MSDPLRCYAVRRVNPFAGVLQVVETHPARAYSLDGRVWQVQVLTRRPDHTWRSFGDIEPIEQFFNYGLWDPDRGLHRIPANPVLDIGGMQAAADALTEHGIRPALDRLPFPLVDGLECWATDHRGNPVALLATTEDRRRLGDIRPQPWLATRNSDHSFRSATLLATGVPADGPLGPRQHAERLERQVRRIGQHKTWFERAADGGGRALHRGAKRPTLDAAAFPPLGLATDWAQKVERGLVEDYIAWLAPRLLLLQHLDDSTRARLEPAACLQAVELAAGYRLIPRVIDHARIEAARVEARLRRTAI